MQLRSKQTALFSLKLLLSIAVPAYIARGLDLGRLRTRLVSVNPFLLALVLAAHRAARLVFRGQGGEGCGTIAELRNGEGRGGIEPPLTRLNHCRRSNLHRVGLPHPRASLRFLVPR